MIGGIDAGTTAALVGVLEDGEQILGGLNSVGAALVLTDRRLAIVHQGWRHRPKTGIRSWRLDGGLGIQAIPRRASGALLIERGQGSTTFFVAERDWSDAQTLAREARRLSAKAVK